MPAYDWIIWDDLRTWDDTEVFADIVSEEVTQVGTPPVVTFTAYDSTDQVGKVTVPAFTGITTTYEFTDVVPAGYLLDKIIVQGDATNACTFDLGTTSGGTEIYKDLAVGAGTYVVVSTQMYFGYTSATTLYLDNVSAGGAVSLTVAFVLSKIYAT